MPTVHQDVQGNKSIGVGQSTVAVPLIRSMDGMVTSVTAARQELANNARDLKVVQERQVRMHGTLSSIEHQSHRLVESLSDTIATAATSVMDKVQPALDNAVKSLEAATAATTARLDATNRPPGWTPSIAPVQQSAAQQAIVPAAERATTVDKQSRAKRTDAADGGLPAGGLPPEPPPANSEMWGRGRGVSIGELRQALGRAVGEGMQNAGRSGPKLSQEVDKDGVARYRNAAGQFASKEEIDAFHSTTKVRRVLANYGDSVVHAGSLGKGILNAAPGMIGKSLGFAGAAYAIGNQAADFAEGQRRANNEYVSMEGGGQASALRERGRERAFALGQRARSLFGQGGLTGEDANQLFQGATRIGLHGQERQQALNFGTENFRKYGMEISESLDLMTTAAEHGASGLSGLTKSLDEVTKAAVVGGVNTAEARKNFGQAYQAASGNFTDNRVAQVSSGALASTFAGLGKDFQNIDYSGLFSEQSMRRIAAQNGTTFNKVAELQGAQGGVQYTRMAQASLANLSGQQFGKGGSELISRLTAQARAQADKTGKPLTMEEIRKITSEAEKQPGFSLDRGNVARVLGQFGLGNVEASNSLETLVQFGSLNADPETAAQDIAGAGKAFGTRGDKGRDKLADAIGLSKAQVANLAGRHGGILGRDAEHFITESKHPFSLHGSAKDRARMAYAEKAAKDGHASPIIAALLKDFDPNRRIKVKGLGKDHKSQDRVMTVEEAIKFHADQLESGQAEIVQGQGAGGTVADATGLQGDTSVKVTSDKKTEGRKTGHEFSEWDKKWGSGKKDKGSSGNVTITPSPELQRLLRFSPSGSARLGATTPPDPHAIGRPTGQPGIY